MIVEFARDSKEAKDILNSLCGDTEIEYWKTGTMRKVRGEIECFGVKCIYARENNIYVTNSYIIIPETEEERVYRWHDIENYMKTYIAGDIEKVKNGEFIIWEKPPAYSSSNMILDNFTVTRWGFYNNIIGYINRPRCLGKPTKSVVRKRYYEDNKGIFL